jgi:hypothetical protein
MDPALKTGLAICVLSVGVYLASWFRHERLPTAVLAEDREEEVLLRCRADVALQARRAGRSLAVQPTTETSTPPRPATVVMPSVQHEPPPAPAPEYPEPRRPAAPGWGVSMHMMLPQTSANDEAARTHVVVDGDTLSALAERYLGSTARAQEIYQLNRSVLPDPKLLPIGVELKLPLRDGRPASAAAPTANTTPSGPLVPVR